METIKYTSFYDIGLFNEGQITLKELIGNTLYEPILNPASKIKELKRDVPIKIIIPNINDEILKILK